MLLIKENLLKRKSKDFLNQLERIILWFLVFLSPSQLIKHFWPSWSLVFGIRVDYLSLSISLSEILVLALFLSWSFKILLFEKKELKRTFLLISNFWFFGLISLFLVNLFFSDYKINTLFSWSRVFLLLWLFYYLAFYQKRRFSDWFFKPASFSLILFGFLALFQFIKGSTFGSLFYWLGERSFNKNTPGIALVSLMGRDFLRPYSTFSHPNSLAGFFGLFLILFLSFIPNSSFEIFLKRSVLPFSFFVFLLSFSRGSFLALLFCLFIFWLSKRKKLSEVYFWLVTLVFLISLFSLFVSDYWKEIPFLDKNIRERFSLIMSTKDVFIKHPVFGVGLNNFILKTSYTFDIKAINYQLQPVHNIYLLVLSELGFFGFLFFYLTLLKIAHVASLILKPWFFLALTFVIISGVADHYWLTLTQNRLALVFLVSGIFQEKNGKRKNHR